MRDERGADSDPVASGAPGATTLGRDLLLVTGRFGLPAGEHEILVRAGDRAVRARALVHPEGWAPGLVVVPMGGTGLPAGSVDALRLDVEGEFGIVSSAVDLPGVLRGGLSAASPDERQRALDFLNRACISDPERIPPEVSHALSAARGILRERLPAAVIDRELSPSARIEVLVRVDARRYYLRGWIGYQSEELRFVTLVAPEGHRVIVPPTMVRFRRTDVGDFYGVPDGGPVDFGFAGLCALEHASGQATGWLVEVETNAGTRIEVLCPAAIEAIDEARAQLVSELVLDRPPGQALRAHHLVPAIARIQERISDAVRITRVEQFGDPPESPDVTIVVPLYKRLEFVEHQLAQFVLDPQVAFVDVIYVLDSPEQEEMLMADAQRLSRLYRQPFRVVVLSANGGFSAANNLGVSQARGRLILLMNSDVLPDRPGWLGKLVEFHDSLGDPGAVGPKLVYEDESLQHAGMYFERPPGARLWFNEHYFKGLHRDFPPATQSRPVPAVTAACLLMRTELYREVGGLRGVFVQGDFEDSDLCMRLSEAGHENWYAAHVELYHLEGQSYPSPQRHANGEFNRWLHTHLWDSRIEARMAKEACV